MTLRFRRRKFRSDAAAAVCDAFAGQPFRAPTYMIDPGIDAKQRAEQKELSITHNPGFSNAPVVQRGDDPVGSNAMEPRPPA